MKAKLQQSSFLIKALLLVCFMLLGSTIAILAWTLITQETKDANSLKIMQLFQSVGMFILPCFGAVYFWTNKPMQFIGLSQKTNAKALLSVSLLMIVALPAINLLGYINQQMELPEFLSDLEVWMKTAEENAAKVTEQFLQVNTIRGLMFNVLLMAMLPAFGEELLFRGVIQKLFSEKGKTHIAIWVSAILFSAIHMQFYGFIPRMLLGALFGYMFVWGGSLWLPIVAHFTNNAFAVIIYFMAYNNNWNMETFETFGSGPTLWLGVLSSVAVLVGIYLIRKCLQKD